MYPYIHIFQGKIASYALMAAIGVILCGFLCCRKGMKYKFDDNDMIILLLIVAAGVVVGGHILFALTNIKLIGELIIKYCEIGPVARLQYLVNIFGGQVFYGGLIGGLLAGFIFAKCMKWDTKLLSFITAPYIPLFHVFGRIGCFLGGCCYGIESKFGFTFHDALIESANGVNRFPVQLVEAGCNFILFLVLLAFQKKEKFKNTLLYVYIMSYGVVRFSLEFLRGDEYRGFVGPLSTSQIISILLFTFSIVMILKNKKELKLVEAKKVTKKNTRKKGTK